MINVSDKYNKVVKGSTQKVNYANVTLKDGTVLNLEPSDFILGGFSMTDETTTGKFGIGHTVAKTISLTLDNHTDKYSMYDFYKAIMIIYVSVTAEDGVLIQPAKGVYHIINPTSPGDVISLSGVDSMYLFDKPYSASTVYPATLQSILTDCCSDCGVSIGFGQFENYNYVVQNKPEKCTYRQVVSWVAQIAGYNARINNYGFLELVWYDTALIEDILSGGKLFSYNEENIYSGGDFTTYTDEILFNGGNFTDPAPENIAKIKSIKVSTDDVLITGVKVKNGEVEALAGEEGYCITLSDNPFAEGKESEVAEYLGTKLIGLQFRPLSCEIANNPLIEPFDICYVYDRKGNPYLTFINSVQYSISGFTKIACKAEDPIRNESSYVSKEAQAVVEAKKEAAKQLSTYDKAVQNINMLAANAMGLYRESEEKTDGSVIYYQSNRPIYKNENGVCEFVTNSVVYKMTGDGFFVSTDGGLSYTSGFDAQGNAVVNVLSAIGITFDWARGGTLTLGGADNVNGSLSVLDKDGNVIGKWDKDGITVSGADEKITKITKDTVTTEFINALNVKAGSVDAENIVGTTISGKNINLLTEKGYYVSLDANGFRKYSNNYTYNMKTIIYSQEYEISGISEVNFIIPKEFSDYELVFFLTEIGFKDTSNINFLSNVNYDYELDRENQRLSVTANITGYTFNGKNASEMFTKKDGYAKALLLIFA